MAEEFKSYDSNDEYRAVGVRLTKDAEARDTSAGKMCRLQIVSTSRNKGKNDIEDLWVEANVADFFVEAASFMKKSDVLHEVRGKPYVRRYGEGKFSFCLERAQLVIPSELKKTLKERGWSGTGTPGGGSTPTTPSRKVSQTSKRSSPREIEALPED